MVRKTTEYVVFKLFLFFFLFTVTTVHVLLVSLGLTVKGTLMTACQTLVSNMSSVLMESTATSVPALLVKLANYVMSILISVQASHV